MHGGGVQGSVIVSSGQNKRKSFLPWILLVLSMVAVIIITVIFLIKNGPLGANTDEIVYNLMNDSYDEITDIQDFYIEASDGEYDASGFFSQGAKDYLNSTYDEIDNFRQKVNEIDSSRISLEIAQENFSILKDALNNDISVYQNIISLYDMFYNYVNNNFDSTYADEIIQTNNTAAINALQNLDLVIAETGDYQNSNIVQDIFSVYINEDFTNVYYYEYMGKLIGELQNDEG